MNGNSSQLILQPRDRSLLSELRTFRFVDHEQARHIAGFSSVSRVKQRLLALVRAGHLDRFFLGTISGGRRAIYHLPGEIRNRRSEKQLASIQRGLFVEHQLAINSFRLRLETGLLLWRDFSAPISSDSKLLPDGYVELQRNGSTIGAFVEIDMGSESLTVWQRKVSGYLTLASAGFAAKELGRPTFRVLVIASTEARICAIRSMIAKQTDKVFWLANIESINREGVWSTIWRRPSGDHMHSLL